MVRPSFALAGIGGKGAQQKRRTAKGSTRRGLCHPTRPGPSLWHLQAQDPDACTITVGRGQCWHQLRGKLRPRVAKCVRGPGKENVCPPEPLATGGSRVRGCEGSSALQSGKVLRVRRFRKAGATGESGSFRKGRWWRGYRCPWCTSHSVTSGCEPLDKWLGRQ